MPELFNPERENSEGEREEQQNEEVWEEQQNYVELQGLIDEINQLFFEIERARADQDGESLKNLAFRLGELLEETQDALQAWQDSLENFDNRSKRKGFHGPKNNL